MNAISYRIIESMDDMLEVEELQCIVWGMTKEHTLSAGTMRWMVHIGGLLLGAWDGDKLVGFSVGSPGKREGKWVFWSDMAGIHPDYQSRGFGYQLKLMQKKWVRDQGYAEIRWTFDPMRRGNAYFNFCKLGVISSLYHPSFYGEMKDSINTGIHTDRLEAVWSTSDEEKQVPLIVADAPFALEFDGQLVKTHPITGEQICIEIPYELDLLKSRDLSFALGWQEAVRDTFMKCFQTGYTTIGFEKKEKRCWYILHER